MYNGAFFYKSVISIWITDSELYFEDLIPGFIDSYGDRDVGDIVMLATWNWWQIEDVGNQNGQNCHQHISSPTSVNNLDVTLVWNNLLLDSQSG